MRSILTGFLILVTISGYSQYTDYTMNFEASNQDFRLEIDTVSNPNNIWQVGVPNKKTFTEAYSLPTAIVTDTVLSYPVNDTSSFIVTYLADEGFEYLATVALSGKYRVESDSLVDFGTIEFSPDNGITWIDLITDTFYQKDILWWSPKPVLTGKSEEWVDFSVYLAGLGRVFDIHFFDTIQYRFTFISDSIQTNKDGLIFDDLRFEDWWEGIEKINNDFISKAFPNPTSGTSRIEFENIQETRHQLTIYTNSGQCILRKELVNCDQTIVDISQYPSGEYIYLIQNMLTGKRSSGRILKN